MNHPRHVLALIFLAALAPACRTGQPLLDSSPHDHNAPGTIAGIVTAGGEPLVGRRVEAVAVGSTGRYGAVTSVTGGFSIPVPPGKYRLQVTLLEGEKVTREPGVIDINESDLDANLEVMIGL
jgi:carboxypeptidase family protein